MSKSRHNPNKEFKRSRSSNEEEQNSSFNDYEEDDEFDENSENLNYLDLMSNSESFEEAIRNFKNGMERVNKRICYML